MNWIRQWIKYRIYRIDLFVAKRIAWRYLRQDWDGRRDWEWQRFLIMAHDLYAIGASRPVIVTRGQWFIIPVRGVRWPWSLARRYVPKPSVRRRLERMEQRMKDLESTRMKETAKQKFPPTDME